MLTGHPLMLDERCIMLTERRMFYDLSFSNVVCVREEQIEQAAQRAPPLGGLKEELLTRQREERRLIFPPECERRGISRRRMHHMR